MTFYIFSCSTKKDLFCATNEPTGAKLPAEGCSGGTWVSFAQRKELRGSLTDEAEQNIREHGYYLIQGKVIATTPVSKKP